MGGSTTLAWDVSGASYLIISPGVGAALLVAVSEICRAHPEIVELDLNPVVAGPNGLSILDARVLVG